MATQIIVAAILLCFAIQGFNCQEKPPLNIEEYIRFCREEVRSNVENVNNQVNPTLNEINNQKKNYYQQAQDYINSQEGDMNTYMDTFRSNMMDHIEPIGSTINNIQKPELIAICLQTQPVKDCKASRINPLSDFRSCRSKFEKDFNDLEAKIGQRLLDVQRKAKQLQEDIKNCGFDLQSFPCWTSAYALSNKYKAMGENLAWMLRKQAERMFIPLVNKVKLCVCEVKRNVVGSFTESIHDMKSCFLRNIGK